MAEKCRIVIIRIRGRVNVSADIGDTMKMLRLFKKNYCIVVSSTDANMGMIDKVKDYVTFGELDEPTFIELLSKRGKLPSNKPLTADYFERKTGMKIEAFAKEFMSFKKDLRDVPGLKLFFRLAPPRKGFERDGIKKPYSTGGVLGYRRDKINDLIRRMI